VGDLLSTFQESQIVIAQLIRDHHRSLIIRRVAVGMINQMSASTAAKQVITFIATTIDKYDFLRPDFDSAPYGRAIHGTRNDVDDRPDR
jgi:hypothetical protein